jgi:hypothetical protein
MQLSPCFVASEGLTMAQLANKSLHKILWLIIIIEGSKTKNYVIEGM